MTLYRIVFKRSIMKDIRRLPSAILQHLREAMEALRTNPFPQGYEKIRGYENHYRIRVM